MQPPCHSSNCGVRARRGCACALTVCWSRARVFGTIVFGQCRVPHYSLPLRRAQLTNRVPGTMGSTAWRASEWTRRQDHRTLPRWLAWVDSGWNKTTLRSGSIMADMTAAPSRMAIGWCLTRYLRRRRQRDASTSDGVFRGHQASTNAHRRGGDTAVRLCRGVAPFIQPLLVTL